MAEAFNSLFKGELIHNPLKRGRGWASITDVEFAVAEYVDWLSMSTRSESVCSRVRTAFSRLRGQR
ncbi:hypothetical protein ACFQZU_11660, partial [Streptomonospora algeriensis]